MKDLSKSNKKQSIEVVEKEIDTVGELKKWLEVLRDNQKIKCDIQLLQDDGSN